MFYIQQHIGLWKSSLSIRTGNFLSILSHNKGVLNKLTLQNQIFLFNMFLVCLFLDNFSKHDGDKKPYREHQSFY